MKLSVIVPARNEADVIRPCLESLLSQSDAGFALGTEWELLLVDDGSTDNTRSIALSLPEVTVLDPGPLPAHWTGKANAVWAAAQVARGEWLLFTDADTIHQPGDLERAIHEAENDQAAMLAYSPRQIVQGFWQRALMPLVFSELAFAYPPEKVSDPASRLAAANGQFLMVEREAYFQVGGHSAVAGSSARRRRSGLPFETQKISHPLSLRARRAQHENVSRRGGDARRLDQKSGPAVPIPSGHGRMEGS